MSQSQTFRTSVYDPVEDGGRHFNPQVQMDWFEQDGRVKTPIPVRPDKMHKLGEPVWLPYNRGQFGTIVSEDVCWDGEVPCYLIRTFEQEYLPCYAGNVVLLFSSEAAHLFATVAEVLYTAWRTAHNQHKD